MQSTFFHVAQHDVGACKSIIRLEFFQSINHSLEKLNSGGCLHEVGLLVLFRVRVLFFLRLPQPSHDLQLQEHGLVQGHQQRRLERDFLDNSEVARK